MFTKGENTMSENELKSEVLKKVEDSGMQVSDEDLTIIVGNVENWLTLTSCNIGEAVKHTLNYEDPWNN